MSNTMKEFLSTVRDTNRYICPLCSETRKKKSERTLSVTVDNESVKYTCWHCDEAGGFSHEQLRQAFQPPPQQAPKPRAISVPKESDEDKGRKSAVKLYNSEDEAKERVASEGDNFYVEVRKGEKTRCAQDWCGVSQWCDQYQAEVWGNNESN